MTRKLIHYQIESDLAVCGKHLQPERLTTFDDEVTCRMCQKTGHRGPINNRERAHLNPDYGNHDFKGRGILRCRNCNRPYRDHPVAAPCPFQPDR